jgi:hypothetical protein
VPDIADFTVVGIKLVYVRQLHGKYTILNGTAILDMSKLK